MNAQLHKEIILLKNLNEWLAKEEEELRQKSRES